MALRFAAQRAAGAQLTNSPALSGMSLANFAKILKCAGNDDIITMKANDDGDTVSFMFESPSAWRSSSHLARALAS